MLHGYSTVAPKDFYLRLFQFISVAKNLAKVRRYGIGNTKKSHGERRQRRKQKHSDTIQTKGWKNRNDSRQQTNDS